MTNKSKAAYDALVKKRTHDMFDDPKMYATFHQDIANQILVQQHGPGWYWDKQTRSVVFRVTAKAEN